MEDVWNLQRSSGISKAMFGALELGQLGTLNRQFLSRSFGCEHSPSHENAKCKCAQFYSFLQYHLRPHNAAFLYAEVIVPGLAYNHSPASIQICNICFREGDKSPLGLT